MIRAAQLGVVGVLAVAGTAVGDGIDAATHINVGNAATVATVVIPAVWWLSSWMRGINDAVVSMRQEMTSLKKRIDDMECVECGGHMKRKGTTTR